MRLRACMSGILLSATACAQLPERLRIDVDGRMVEIRQRGLSDRLLAVGWSSTAQCGADKAEELEVTRANGETLRLYRCLP